MFLPHSRVAVALAAAFGLLLGPVLGASKAPAPVLRGAQTAPPATAVLPAKAAEIWGTNDIAAAQAECASLLQGLTLEMTYLAPFKHGQCGAPMALELRAFGTAPRVVIDPPATLNCKMAAALAHWMSDKVQPLAAVHLRSKITIIRNAASYDCRNRYGDPKAKLSEHAKADALDIAAFVTAAGKTVDVGSNWGSTLRELLSARPIQPATQIPGTDGFATTVKPVAEPAKPDEAALAAKLHKGSDAVRKARTADAVRRGIVMPTPVSPEAIFIRAVHDSACQTFYTTLGPESNDAHKEHFHLDMTQRDGGAYCE